MHLQQYSTFAFFFMLLLGMGLSFPASSQENYTRVDDLPQRIQEKFSGALDAYYLGDMSAAESAIIKLLDKYDHFLEGYLLLGDIYMELKQYPRAVNTYEKVIAIDPEYSRRFLMILGNAQFSASMYHQAVLTYQKALEWEEITPKQAEVARRRIATARFRDDQLNHPLPFDPVSLGPGVNSEDDEYVNALNPEETKLFITRKEANDNPDSYREFREEFYYSQLGPDGWEEARILDDGTALELNGDAGAMTVSVDGQKMYFVACFRGGQGSCDLFVSQLSGGKWTRPINLGHKINSESWDSQPSLSPDGRTLYFASTRGNNVGKSDLWMIRKTRNGEWGEPINLGKEINTVGSEMAPFIHFDNQTLYFASDGHIGMGGLDIYMTRKDSTGNFTGEIFNLGYPLNGDGNDITIIVNARGDKGYISAERDGGYGGYDVYEFDLPEKIRPLPVTYMKGIISDIETGERLQARFELIELASGRVVMDAQSAEDGSFLVCIPTGKNYALNVSRENYLFYSGHFSLAGFNSAVDPYVKDILLEPVKEGSTTILNNVFFDFDSYELKPESYPELERLVDFLFDNPSVTVEVGGHTDEIGTDEYNRQLSERRAAAVAEYVISRGVDKSRVTYQGYGASKPIDTNKTEEGRARNRRTAVKIISSK